MCHTDAALQTLVQCSYITSLWFVLELLADSDFIIQLDSDSYSSINSDLFIILRHIIIKGYICGKLKNVQI